MWTLWSVFETRQFFFVLAYQLKEVIILQVYAYKEWARDQGNDCSWKHEGPTLKQSLSLGISNK